MQNKRRELMTLLNSASVNTERCKKPCSIIVLEALERLGGQASKETIAFQVWDTVRPEVAFRRFWHNRKHTPFNDAKSTREVVEIGIFIYVNDIIDRQLRRGTLQYVDNRKQIVRLTKKTVKRPLRTKPCSKP